VATRGRFTQEYREQAVSLHLDSGRSITEVARSSGVHEMTLGKWVKKAKDDGWVPDKDLSETERAELERLRKDNAVLRMERVSRIMSMIELCRCLRDVPGQGGGRSG